jgi:hypothetical protein
MFIGCLISAAFFSATAITRRASLNVTMATSSLKICLSLTQRQALRRQNYVERL